MKIFLTSFVRLTIYTPFHRYRYSLISLVYPQAANNSKIIEFHLKHYLSKHSSRLISSNSSQNIRLANYLLIPNSTNYNYNSDI